MSALAQPFIHPTGTINSEGEAVNIETVQNIATLDVDYIENQPNEYQIIFTYKEISVPKAVWKYADSASRDTSYTNILTAVSAAIA